MKEIAKLKQLPPVYNGKWANATEEEVQEELSKGTPNTYRFRVPKEVTVKINDLIRGDLSWNLDTLGDFVIMRSNGEPVYNFCAMVDDASMAITHVVRAEEHLPNTSRQALTYKALGFPMPYFAHVSLILAPDRNKLSKRHGATSVGQFREMGYLPPAMVVEWSAFGSLPSGELNKLIGERWKSSGILRESEGLFVEDALQVLKNRIDLIKDADEALLNLLFYPLYATLASPESKFVIEDRLSEIAASLLTAYDSGELLAALEEGLSGWQKWIKSFGGSLKRKGKSLFMPL